jgi:hypothetical protein
MITFSSCRIASEIFARAPPALFTFPQTQSCYTICNITTIIIITIKIGIIMMTIFLGVLMYNVSV